MPEAAGLSPGLGRRWGCQLGERSTEPRAQAGYLTDSAGDWLRPSPPWTCLLLCRSGAAQSEPVVPRRSIPSDPAPFLPPVAWQRGASGAWGCRCWRLQEWGGGSYGLDEGLCVTTAHPLLPLQQHLELVPSS